MLFWPVTNNMFKTRHCYRRSGIRVKVSPKYRTPTETFPKITTKLGNHSSCSNLISFVVFQTRLSHNPFTGVLHFEQQKEKFDIM